MSTNNFILGLRGKYLLYLMGIGVCLVALLTLNAARTQKKKVFQELERKGTILIQDLAVASAGYTLSSRRKDISELVSNAASWPDVRYVVYLSSYAALSIEKGEHEGVSLDEDLTAESPLSFKQDGAGFHWSAPIVQEIRTQSNFMDLLSGEEEEGPGNVTKQVIGTVHLGLSTERAENAVRSFALGSGAASLVILLLGGLVLSLVFERTMLTPLDVLTAATDAVRQGDLDQRIPVLAGTGEIGHLARSFNEMTSELKITKEELIATNQNLELKVAERTRELSAANVQLQELNVLKSKFVSMVSHELRTPLASIKGFSSFLLKYQKKMTPEKITNYYEIIDRESDRLARLIEELLDISRIQEGRVEFKKKVQDVKIIAAHVAETLKIRAQVNFVLDFAPGSETALCDHDKIEQVFFNLAGNAIKYAPKDSTITFKAFPKGDFNVYEVKDEGSGIPEDKFTQVFESFYRVDDEANLTVPGTGLGLTITKAIVEAHGGQISLRNNTPEKGCCFFFTLPQREPKDPADVGPGADDTRKAGD